MLTAGELPTWLNYGSSALGASALVLASVRLPWFANSQPRLTAWLGGSTFLLLLWQLRAISDSGVIFHLLGASALTLIAGWHRALLGLAAISAIDLYQRGLGWHLLAPGFVCDALLPVILTQQLLHWAQRRLPHNFFIYVFINSFAAAALSILASGLLNCLLLATATGEPADRVLGLLMPIYLLLAFPEAFISGLLLTILVIWRPQWVASFDDRLYLSVRR